MKIKKLLSYLRGKAYSQGNSILKLTEPNLVMVGHRYRTRSLGTIHSKNYISVV